MPLPSPRRSFVRCLCGALALVGLAAKPVTLVAQDVVLSQFYAAPLLLNPGFAGTSRAPTINLVHRSQYVGFASTTPYQTYAVSYGQYVPGIRSGIGLSIVADDAGDNLYGTYSAQAAYAYGIRIDEEHTVRLGLNAGLQHRRIDWERLVFGDQLGPQGEGPLGPSAEQRPDNLSVTFADFGAGVLYVGPDVYAGVSLLHVTTPDDRIASLGDGGFYEGLPMRLGVHAGYQIDLSRGRPGRPVYVTPNLLYARQGPFEQLNAGAYASFGQIFAGLWFRHAFGNPDAAIGSFGVEWDMYKLGYSYDAAVSGLASVSSGSHEIALSINFDEAPWIKQRRRDSRYNDCLNLFR